MSQRAKRILKVGLIQQANTADRSDNKRRLREAIRRVASEGAELVVLQELHNGLYFCQREDVDTFDEAESIPGESTSEFGELARELGIVLVLSLFERRAAGLYHNTSVVLERDPAYYEKFYFTPGDLGFEPIETSVGRLGVLVCWDQWYPEAARLMALSGAELLIYPTAIGWESSDASGEQTRQSDAWQLVQRGHAVANGLPVVTVNRVGHEADPSEQTGGITFWGRSFVAGPQGELLVELDQREATCVVEIDLARSERVRRWWPFLRDRRIDAFSDLTKRYRR